MESARIAVRITTRKTRISEAESEKESDNPGVRGGRGQAVHGGVHGRTDASNHYVVQRVRRTQPQLQAAPGIAETERTVERRIEGHVEQARNRVASGVAILAGDGDGERQRTEVSVGVSFHWQPGRLCARIAEGRDA